MSGTSLTLPLDQYTGAYHAKSYGDIRIVKEGDELHITFEHTPDLAAKLVHWHNDVFELQWKSPEVLAWFSFGTIQFELSNNGNVTGISFDVPNDDFFFEELNATKK